MDLVWSLHRSGVFGGMATIGREKAVADLRGLQLGRVIAWWLWSVVHVAFMADARNCMAVILDCPTLNAEPTSGSSTISSVAA